MYVDSLCVNSKCKTSNNGNTIPTRLTKQSMEVFMDINDNGALPIGFGMNLAQDEKAMEGFSALSETEREKLVQYIKASSTGDEAKERIKTVVHDLHYRLY